MKQYLILLASIVLMCSCQDTITEDYEFEKEQVFVPTQEDLDNITPFYNSLLDYEIFNIPEGILTESQQSPGFWSYINVILYCVNDPVFWDTVGEGDEWEVFFESVGYKYFKEERLCHFILII